MKNRSFFILISLSLSGNILISQTKSVPLKYEASQGFVAHEWGTFTSLRASDGTVLDGLEREEEHLPEFTYNLCQCYREGEKGSPKDKNAVLKNVTIKMETPVLYFYSPEDQEKKLSVNIGFPKGSISQWYPERSGGEEPKYSMPTRYIWTGTQPGPPDTFDFSIPRNGYIQWNATIIPLWKKLAFSNDRAQETKQWLAQRETACNLVKIKDAVREYDPIKKAVVFSDQIEKFLFYRGIGNFREPINISFNSSGNLVISNSGIEKFSYVLVYEKKRNGKVVIWWSGLISGNKTKVVVKPSGEGTINPVKEHEKFVKKLVAAGLYENEARAMLKTWEKSYFEHEGLKVFWIVPRSFTDEVLPIQISPQPDLLGRVLVGRSEVLTPEFERELEANSNPDTTDRFSLAYKKLLSQGIPQVWTDYNVATEDEIEPEEPSDIPTLSDSKNIELFPNPVTGNLVVKIYDDVEESFSINIYESTGKLIRSNGDARLGENSIEMGGFPNGLYCVKVEFADGKCISKKIIKN